MAVVPFLAVVDVWIITDAFGGTLTFNWNQQNAGGIGDIVMKTGTYLRLRKIA